MNTITFLNQTPIRQLRKLAEQIGINNTKKPKPELARELLAEATQEEIEAYQNKSLWTCILDATQQQLGPNKIFDEYVESWKKEN